VLALVEALGAVAGLAAVVGLVVLSALYVSHAREVKRLRAWAGGAPEGVGPDIAVPGRTGGVRPATQRPVPGRAGGVRPATQRLVPGRAGGVRPATQRPTVAGAPGTRASRRATAPRRGRIGGRLAPALVGLLAVGGVATYGVSRLVGGDGPDRPGKTEATNNNASAPKPRRRRVAVQPATVTVAVLNATTVYGLAAGLSEQIVAAGFRKGTIDVFSDQQLAQSVVEYAPGRLAAAKAVGRIVGIRRWQPVTPTGRALAGDATVIVIAGADKAP
jgi:hypothetical protein